MKIRTQLFLLIFTAGLLCFSLYHFLWLHKWDVWILMGELFPDSLEIFPVFDENFWINLGEEALKYNIPESMDDKDGAKALEPFFDLMDDYTGIYIYGLEDGMYRAGRSPSFTDSQTAVSFFNELYYWTDGHGEESRHFSLEFKNGYASVTVTSLHRTFFVAPYFFFCFTFCIILFFIIVLFFINRKMKSVILLKQNILQMASGDLETPLPTLPQDEIGILFRELDNLRQALKASLLETQESRKSNQDLVAALSHDLRTPLTILKGYLEIIRRTQDTDMQEQYLDRCLHKTDEIKEMTDRIFEYTLVYEDADLPSLSPLPADVLYLHLAENADFLELTGFHVELSFPESAKLPKAVPAQFLGDTALLKRVFNNLFSNIIKYGDKKEPVIITGSLDGSCLSVSLQNAVKVESSGIESTKIGLKSVHKMLELMNGCVRTKNKDAQFTVELTFPIYRSQTPSNTS